MSRSCHSFDGQKKRKGGSLLCYCLSDSYLKTRPAAPHGTAIFMNGPSSASKEHHGSFSCFNALYTSGSSRKESGHPTRRGVANGGTAPRGAVQLRRWTSPQNETTVRRPCGTKRVLQILPLIVVFERAVSSRSDWAPGACAASDGCLLEGGSTDAKHHSRRSASVGNRSVEAAEVRARTSARGLLVQGASLLGTSGTREPSGHDHRAPISPCTSRRPDSRSLARPSLASMARLNRYSSRRGAWSRRREGDGEAAASSLLVHATGQKIRDLAHRAGEVEEDVEHLFVPSRQGSLAAGPEGREVAEGRQAPKGRFPGRAA